MPAIECTLYAYHTYLVICVRNIYSVRAFNTTVTEANRTVTPTILTNYIHPRTLELFNAKWRTVLDLLLTVTTEQQ